MKKTMRTAIARKAAVIASCGLLEKSYFCSIANNAIPKYHRTTSVVICLKNRTFAVSQTTQLVQRHLAVELWFAWKIVLLQYRKQPSSRRKWPGSVVICLKNRTFAVSQTTWDINSRITTSCDLLEKSYFCSIANNVTSSCPKQAFVVICLKNRTFAVSQTTRTDGITKVSVLWFAWKIVLLQYRKQPSINTFKFSAVVICLKNRTFAVSQTTGSRNLLHHQQLWFAWKIVLLQYRKQP